MTMDMQEVKKRLGRISSYKHHRLSNLDRMAVLFSLRCIREIEREHPDLYYVMLNRVFDYGDLQKEFLEGPGAGEIF